MKHKTIAGFFAGVTIALFLPFLVPSSYYLHLIIITVIYAIVASGVALQYRVGLISLGAATFWGLGAYVSALLSLNLNLPLWICSLLAAITSAIIALLLGFPAVKSGRIGFIVLTLVMNGIFVQVVGATESLGGWVGLIGIKHLTLPIPFLESPGTSAKIPYYFLALCLLGFTVFVFHRLYQSYIGRAWSAIGLDLNLAESIGITTFRYKLAAFVIAAVSASLAGSLYASYQGFLVPRAFTIVMSAYFLMYAIIGGVEFALVGPIVGTFIGIILPEVLRISESFEPLFFGLTLILVMRFLPRGILSLPRQFPIFSRALQKIGAKWHAYIRSR